MQRDFESKPHWSRTLVSLRTQSQWPDRGGSWILAVHGIDGTSITWMARENGTNGTAIGRPAAENVLRVSLTSLWKHVDTWWRLRRTRCFRQRQDCVPEIRSWGRLRGSRPQWNNGIVYKYARSTPTLTPVT